MKAIPSVLLSIVLSAACAQGTVLFDTMGVPVIGSVGIDSDHVVDPRWAAQRFTTGSSGELTIRRINFAASLPLYSFPATISIRNEVDGAPGLSEIGSLFTQNIQDGTNSAYGEVELAPSTSYWAVFQLDTPSIPYDNAALLDLAEPTSGFGLWGNYPSDSRIAAAAYIFDWQGQLVQTTMNFYSFALRMEISSVPEPSVFAITGSGLLLRFMRRRVKR